jgi:predicted SnoaL-like aldol condensation-catalyzing enzyme
LTPPGIAADRCGAHHAAMRRQQEVAMGDAGRGKGRLEVFASAMECERAFYQAFTACDLAAMEAVWADEDPSCIHPGGGLLRTRDEVIDSWAAIFQDALAPRIRVHVVSRVSEGGLAVHLVREQISHGEQTSHVLTTNVFRRFDEGWRMIAHHGSMPPLKREPAAAGRSLH